MKKSSRFVKFFILPLLALFGAGLIAVRFNPVTPPRQTAPGVDAGQSESHQPQSNPQRESEARQSSVRLAAARDSSSSAPVSRQPKPISLFPAQPGEEEDAVAQNQLPEREIEEEREREAKPDQPDEALKWRALQLVDEHGHIPHNALINAREQAKQMPFDPSAWPTREQNPNGAVENSGRIGIDVAGIQPTGWTWLGPGNIGGRIRSILTHPSDPQTLWVGSVSGGIWKTTNGGASWSPLDDFMANLSVGSLAMNPADPNVIYAGTGEGTLSGDSLRGAGIFKTTNGGATWTQLPSTSTASWYYVNRLALSPANSQLILAATGTGIWRSTDGGASWSNRLAIRMLDLDFHPTDGSKCIASGTGVGARYSTDGGQTWNAATGLPTSGRIEVAYARSNPSIVYASAEANSGQLYRSTDGGQTYTLVNTGTNYLNNQGWYNNALWVDPTNSDVVIVGGIDLWRSTNGGVSLTQISQWYSAPASAHADNHFIVEQTGFNGSSNKTVFFANDGGIYKANDVYTVALVSGWTELNNNLGITQFYGGAGNPTSGRLVGGTQDNGTLRYTGNTETWNTTYGGDGGWCAADPTNANYFYGEYIHLQIHRSSNGGVSSSSIYTGLTDAEQSRANFIAPFILDPNNPNTLLGGGDRLWRSTNVKAVTPVWSPIKDSVLVNISAIAVAKGNSNIIWVGHNNGDVYFTTNGTAAVPTWTRADTGSPNLPNRYCTRIAIDPANSNRVYVTFGGFSPDNVWRTDDSGASWTNITSNLPSAPVKSLVVWQQNTNYLYVGTEVGVFASANGGQSWSPSNDGPTNCSVDELFWVNSTLVAATHGRGMFSININIGQPPTVSITSPSNGASFASPANISISASASDSDGAVSKVEFFAGSTLVGTATSSPYTVNWNNVVGGTYTLTAKATDNVGDSTVSSPVNIIVGSGGPDNNNFANAQVLSGNASSVTGSNVNATKESGEPSIAGNAGGASIWYQWQAPSSGLTTITTAGSDFDTLLGVYTGNSVNALTLIASNDDDPVAGGFTSRVTFTAIGGTTYRIAVDGYNGATGNITLNLGGVQTLPTVQFSQSSYSVNESASFVALNVTRSGDTSAATTVKYTTSDATDVNFQCNPLTPGQITGAASRKCDYHIAAGRLRFAPGETAKQIVLSLVNDVYVEGPEILTLSLSYPTGATLGQTSATIITITDNDTPGAANPIDGTRFYVRQLYVDLLSREPDPAGWDGWTNRIDLCGQPGQAPPPCDRVTVGGDGFLRSAEFFDRQFFVLRLYRAGLGRIPFYDEVGDLAYVSGFLTDQQLELNKQELVVELMSRAEFVTRYNGLTNASYVDTLLQTAGVSVPQSVRDGWVTALNNVTKTRAQVFRELSERQEVSNRYLHEAQVVSCYYGFFTRNPDGAYFNYLDRLDRGEINLGDLANAFINAAEYRQRFGP